MNKTMLAIIAEYAYNVPQHDEIRRQTENCVMRE